MKKYILYLLLIFCSIFVSVFLGELYLRLFHVQEGKRLASYDKDLGWRGKPNGKGAFVVKKAHINAKFKYNNLGFRDENVYEKKKDSFRIVLLGDSFVESLETEYEKTFHKILEKIVVDSLGGNYEIVIVGSHGYSTAQELSAFKKFKEIIKPDIVLLLFFTGNDFKDNMRVQFSCIDNDGKLKFNQNTNSFLKIQYLSFKRWLYENSYITYFLKRIIVAKTGVTIADNAKNIIGNVSDEYCYNITKLLILETRNEIIRNNSIFGVVVIPTKEEIENKNIGGNNNVNLDFIVNLLNDNKIKFLDLSQVLQKKDYLALDLHFSDSGHKIVAEEIYKFILNTRQM